MFEIMRSLIGPFFGGIWALVSGRFGWRAPIIGAILVTLTWAIFTQINPSATLWVSILCVGVLSLVNASIAFWSFLIVNGNAYERPEKAQSWTGVWITSIVIALVWGTVCGILALSIIYLFFSIHVWLTAFANASLAGTLCAAASVGSLQALFKKSQKTR